jgi:1-acyl-sn-glycerol-3-phosphate acyltransferase
MRQFLQPLTEALFRVLFSYECTGVENLPATGAAVVAANHPSYLDPVLLSLRVARPIHFMAWDALFRVPLLGVLLRSFGAISVDVRAGKGGKAYAHSKALIESGKLLGVFPEGKRSREGWLEPTLREGAVRLALETGAPLVPATIVGAFRAWPHFRLLPKLARISVRFHEPIDPEAYRGLPEEEAVTALQAELRRRVERTLLPGVKADRRIEALYRQPASWPRWHEALPALGLALVVFGRTRSLPMVMPAYGYVLYLLADHFLIPPRRLGKWVRNASPALFLLAFGPVAYRALGLPETVAQGALAAAVLGGMFPYLYERSHTALGFMRGWVTAWLLALAAQFLAPSAVGLHASLPLYMAAFAWERRTVFWRYAAPFLALYGMLVPLWLEAGLEMLPYATVAPLAWLTTRLFPYRVTVSEAEPTALGLKL